jgi:hypothetical protein
MFGREPAAWLAAINAVLACAMGFGLDLTGEQMALIMTTAGTIIGLITRQSVVPSATIRDAGSSPAAIKAQADVNRATTAIEEARKP